MASFNESLQDQRKLKIKKIHNFSAFKSTMEQIEKRQLAAREREEHANQTMQRERDRRNSSHDGPGTLLNNTSTHNQSASNQNDVTMGSASAQ